MKLPFLASFLILIGIVFFQIRKSNHTYEKEELDFWEKERMANATRKKSLDHLQYISIPEPLLSLTFDQNCQELADCMETLKELSHKKIVNFTGISNTDLKLTYGTANITVLTEYDMNYTTLARTLQKTAELLYELNRVDDAVAFLEFSVSTKTDVSKTYYLLARMYRDRQETAKIQVLIEKAQSIPSLLNHSIVHTLQESYL